MPFAVDPPIEPMLAKLADELPAGGDVPLRAEVGRLPRDRLSRRRRRVHPEPRSAAARSLLPRAARRAARARCRTAACVDGEIVIATPHGLDFDALQLRLHPAASRVAKLAKETPAAFVAFDLLAVDGQRPARRCRSASAARGSKRLLGDVAAADPPDADDARSRRSRAEWLARFEGAGLDGVIAKPDDGTYEPGKRAMIKVKHARTADCVVAGFRWHKSGQGRAGRLAAARAVRRRGRAASRRRHLVVHDGEAQGSSPTELAPLREHALDEHPWREWAEADGGETTRMPGGQSRWSAGKDLSWEPLRIERVCEVKYDHMQGDRVPPRGGLPALAARQAAGATAATISSRSRRLTSSRRSSARRPPAADAAPVVRRRRRDRALPAPAAAPPARAAG